MTVPAPKGRVSLGMLDRKVLGVMKLEDTGMPGVMGLEDGQSVER